MIFIFLIVLSAEYSSYVKSIATYTLTFFVYIISVLASVICTATAFHEEERKKKRERNPIYNRFFNKVVVIVFLFTGL